MTDEKKDEAATEEVVAEEVKEEAPAVEETPVKEEKEEAPVVEEEAEEVEVPKEYVKLIEQIEKMTVLELHGLVKVLEKKFGVSAAAVAVSGGADAGAAAEEKSDYIVHLVSIGDSKIGVIKAVKATLGLGLKEAKDLVESAPVDLKSGVKTEEAEEMKTALMEAGAVVELK
ncbi:50S ribosomal protein L7/L12 [Candidatus Kaiserbacteria bacterium]|nr:MAG: 50S ribosomal protein L7/L12 [Candidatus Kaiserbacteria bacterium]